jgi:hypothetical protein
VVLLELLIQEAVAVERMAVLVPAAQAAPVL